MSESTSFVRLFVGFLLSATGASCPIELNPPIVVLRYGHSVSINCSTSESEIDGMGWEATQGGKGLQPVQHLTWTVETLTDWTISPSCYFNPSPNSQFEQCAANPKVVLYTFPETISISSDSDGIIKEEKEHNLTCNIHNIAPVQNLTVTWYKGDTIIFTDTFNNSSRKPVNQTSVLSFTLHRHEDGVTFRCEAHLDLRPEGPQLNVSSQEYKITVHYGPDIECSDNLELLEGQTLGRNCPVTGNPTPFIKWQYNGQIIDPDFPLTRVNKGQYTVEAEGFSYVLKTLQVAVLYGPELECPRNYAAVEDTPNNLTCTVEGYPKPKTIWYKDEEEVELPDNLTRSDAGQYLVTASNSVSTVNVTVDIIVLYPPSQIVELEDSEVSVGSTVSLKCFSRGKPRPEYSWNFFWTDQVTVENEDGVSLLIIHNATGYNTGSYTCHASNDIGNVFKTVRVTVKGATQSCPIEIIPERMVIKYQGKSQNAICKPTSEGLANREGPISWQVQQGINTNSWSADTNTDWDARPVCMGTFKEKGTCKKHLDFTLYKTPDSVSIHNLSSVVEEREFQLRCDIINVAPAQNLTVLWYIGNDTIKADTNGSLQVTDCRDCDISVTRLPLNVSSTINITLNRQHSGVEFRCMAKLDLEPIEPKHQLNWTSSLNITVYYKPSINTTKLPKKIPVFRGYPEDLICEADGYPPPKIQWLITAGSGHYVSGNMLTVSEKGVYRCSAENDVASIEYEVEVTLEEDYLPLIAGFVAVTVVAISIIFLFIYSIYYKNTRMRRYSLKNPKLSTHNGNVAHNGLDLQFPMTKLS